MSINRILSSLIALGASLLLLSEAAAQQTPQALDDTYAYGNAPYSNAAPQSVPSFEPFNPVGFRHKWDFFAPADISDYGNGPKPHVGYFFTYERCYWSISKPTTATVGSAAAAGFYTESFSPIDGSPIVDFENNSLSTGVMTAKGSYGNRWETGYMDVNDHGWLISVIDHVAQTQNFEYSNSTVLYNDPNGLINGFVLNPYTQLFVPVSFVPRYPDTLLYNRIVLNGTEIMRMYRAPRLHHGGVLDLLWGARWFQADDTFQFTGLGGFLADTSVRTRVQNNMIGPQIGLRYSHQRGRWIGSAEGRFTAACNFENLRQNSEFASDANSVSALSMPVTSGAVPTNLNGTSGNASHFAEQFAPIAELRLNATYQITKAFGLTIGYTFMYINGIQRAADHTQYSAPLFGLNNLQERNSIVINGLSFGFQVNR